MYKRPLTFYSGINKSSSKVLYQYWNPTNGDVNYTTIDLTSSVIPDVENISGWTFDSFVNITLPQKHMEYTLFRPSPTYETYPLYALYTRNVVAYSGEQKATTHNLTQYYNSFGNVSSITLPTPTAIGCWEAIGYNINADVSDTQEVLNSYSPGVSASALPLYAVYTTTLTINYNANGGTGTTTSTTKNIYMTSNRNTTSSQVVTLATNSFDYEKYVFASWNTKADGTGTSYAEGAYFNPNISQDIAYNSSMVNNMCYNITLYAQWNPITYTVSYYNGSYKIGTSTHYINTGSSLSLWDGFDPEIINSSAGWEFAGWSRSGISGFVDTNSILPDVMGIVPNSFQDGANIENIAVAGSNIDLYAVYKRTFTAYGGIGVEEDVTQYWNPIDTTGDTYLSSVKFSSLKSKSGWVPLGYIRGSFAAGNANVSANESFYPAVGALLSDYYAVYSRELTFYSGESKSTSFTRTQYYSYSGRYSILTGSAEEKSGWNFIGWRDDATADSAEYTSIKSIHAESDVYYAVYDRELTFISGLASNTSTQVVKQYYNSYNSVYDYSDITVPTPVSIDNWESDLTGWMCISDSEALGDMVLIGMGDNTVYYGAYKRNFNVSYNANGGSGTTSSTIVNARMTSKSNDITFDTVILAANKFTRSGYTFNKWAFGSVDGTQYSAVSSFEPGLSYDGSFDITMYALWTRNPLKIYYNVNGGSATGGLYTANSSGWVLSESSELLISNISEGSDTGPTGLNNYDNSSYLHVVKTGYIADYDETWNTKADGSGISYSQDTRYFYEDFIENATNMGSYYRLNLYINWIEAKPVIINFNVNGGTIANANGFTSDSNGWISLNGQLDFEQFDVGESNHISDYNYSGYMNISKSGYTALSGGEWNTKGDGSGVDLSQTKTYSHAKIQSAAEDKGDYCLLTLYVNWQQTINGIRFKGGTFGNDDLYRVAALNITTCSSGVCHYSTINGLSAFTSFDVFNTADRRVQRNGLSAVVSSFPNAKVTYYSKGSLNCYDKASTSGTVVTTIDSCEELTLYRTTTKASNGYNFYYQEANNCYVLDDKLVSSASQCSVN